MKALSEHDHRGPSYVLTGLRAQHPSRDAGRPVPRLSRQCGGGSD